MGDFLRESFVNGPTPPPLVVFARLVGAMLLGALVAFVYRRTRPAADVASSFTATLVLLAILIAMVTQVIGDNVARAFSLVGALSIVRFRTVVRDTQDTAYVIFAVAVGMAVGAGHPAVALGGIVVVGIAAAAMKRGTQTDAVARAPFQLQVRIGTGYDTRALLGPTLDAHAPDRRLMSVATVRQGLAIDTTYRTTLRTDEAADTLLRDLNRLEGVQSVTLQRLLRADEGDERPS